MKYILVAILASISFTASALSFKVDTDPKGRVFVFASGEIVKGDADRLEAILKSHAGKKVIVFFDSHGGIVIEGINMGYILNASGAGAGIEHRSLDKKAECASACAIAYLGAETKFFSSNSSLGVHMFRYNQAKVKTEADKKRVAADSQRVTKFIYEYAKDVEIPPFAIEAMFKTPHTSMYYFNRKQMEALGAVFVD